MNIAIIVPRVVGGVATIYKNFLRGLQRDGLCIRMYKLDKILYSSLIRDILNISSMKNHDVIMYMGNMPWPSATFLSSSSIVKVLFVHGYIYHELFSTIRKDPMRARIGALASLLLYEGARDLDAIDFYVCPCIATCTMTRIPNDKRVLLPPFLLSEDLDFYESLRSLHSKKERNIIRIVTYGSYVRSPKILASKHIITLSNILEKAMPKKFEVIIVDPLAEPYADQIIKVIRPLPRPEYLRLLASSDIYIERCTDDELRYGALEAMAMGVQVAKLTHPSYKKYVDYDDALINATSISELSRLISQLIENEELEKYSRNAIEYVRKKRTWDYVKLELYKKLKIL